MNLIQFIKSLVIRSNDLDNVSVVITPEGDPNTTTTIVTSQTSDRLVSIPDGSGVVVLEDLAQELTNKEIDGHLNTISNLEVSDFNPTTIVTDLSGTPTNAELPTAAAVRFAFDNQFIRREIYTLTNVDILAGTALITLPSNYTNIVYILPIGGVEVIFGVDAIVVPVTDNSFTLDWTGLESEQLFDENDELLIVYIEQNYV